MIPPRDLADEQCAVRRAIDEVKSLVDPDFAYLSQEVLEEYRTILLRPLYARQFELEVQVDALAWAQLGAQ
jgi:hypothetical protein